MDQTEVIELSQGSHARLLSIAAQHARTAVLFGVEFVPSYRAAGSAWGNGRKRGASDGIGSGEAQQRERIVDRIVEVKPTRGAAQASTVASMFDGAQRRPEQLGEPELPATSSLPSAARALPAARSWEQPAKQPGEEDRAYAGRLMDALRAKYELDAPHKKFVTAHTKIVFGDGDPRAALCFVGEAPGAEEDKTGVPFVGRSGELLNKMIMAMGLSRQTVYICNVLKTRPPDNATPTSKEAAACEPYLVEQLLIVKPRVIVTLGLPASRLLLKTDESMTRMRGQWREITLPGGVRIPVMPTYHPAFLLRSYTEENRGKVWADLRLVMDRLASPAGEHVA